MSRNDEQTPAAFWNLWQSHQDILYRKCLKMMRGNIDEAQDALSTAMLKALEKMLLSCDRIHNFRGWALRLTENVCIDLLRKHRRMISYGEWPESLIEQDDDDGLHVMESRESYHAQRTALQNTFSLVNRLPPRLRQPFLLRFTLAERYGDIALHLGISEETARKRIQEVRAFLKFHFGADSLSEILSSSLQGGSNASLLPTVETMSETILATLDLESTEVAVPRATAWIVPLASESDPPHEVIIFLPLRAHRLETRLPSLLKYVSRHPGGWKKNLELAQILYALGNWPRAETEFRQVLKIHPRAYSAWILLGGMLMESGRMEEAAHLYTEAGSLTRRASSGEFFGGMIALCNQCSDKACAAFQKAIDMEPANLTFRHALGACLFQSKQFAACYGHFQDVLTSTPTDIVALAHCCELSLLLDRPLEAEQYIDLILQSNPHDAFALKRKSGLRRGGAPATDPEAAATRSSKVNA